MSKSKKERCSDCDKILRMGNTMTVSGKINYNTPRNKDGTLKRSREVEYKRICVNPKCPSKTKEDEKE